MGDDPYTTTVEVKGPTYNALDRLRDQGDSFDDVLQDLIDNTAVGMDGLTATAPDVDYGDIEPIPEDAEAYDEPRCAEVDPVTGETCSEGVEYRQEYAVGGEDDGAYFYYCGEHAPRHD